MSYEITEEEKNKVKLNSAFALPTSPSERGMKPEAIKTMLWKPFEVLIGIINESFQKIENADIEHSGSAEAHSDIRLLIEQLNEYVNTLSQQHDIDTNAHADIRQAIQLVHNLASGKAMVHPVADVESFLELLKRDLNEGDIIVTAKKNMPDFIVCSFTDEVERDIEFDDNSFGYGFSFDTENTGLYYVYNRRYDGAKIELLSIESGVDTSKFATKELLEAHKDDADAHMDIRRGLMGLGDSLDNVYASVSEVRDIAEIARSLATGKSKVYWVPSAQIMLYDILDVGEGLNSGDVYVILEKNVPEFAVLSKNTTAFDGAVIIQDPTDEVEYKPGQVYFFAGFNLLAMENGVDTSALATKEELGDIDAALDIIIAIQNSLIGGDAE